MVKRAFIFIIQVYQKTLSPDHSFLKGAFPHGFCPYSPSCSEYTKQAIQKYGAFKGLAKGLWRILRCNPWTRGGVDLP